jgi:hypothetical protein
VPFVVIYGPDSGPGAPGTHPDKLSRTCLETVLSAGSNVVFVGYVSTSSATRAVSAVEQDVNTYAS